jgi:shikimate dehydrogenase
MRKFGLIGYPLGHSFSKKYFTQKFLKEQITECSYENYPLTALDQLKDLISDEPDLCGLNVTIPYKSAVMRFLDYISPEAGEIGAVNVIKINRINSEIKLSGFNSDVIGIKDSLLPYIKGGISSAIILGTGGSSRAVSYVLTKSGLNVTLVSRDRKPGTISYSEITSPVLKKTDLIVNTTPLGMYPDIESKPDIDYSMLSRKHILFDLVYNPELTEFLKMGAERGCSLINGMKMLHSQAEGAWKIWNDEGLFNDQSPTTSPSDKTGTVK